MIGVYIYNVTGDLVKKKDGGEVRGGMDGWMDGVYEVGNGEYEMNGQVA